MQSTAPHPFARLAGSLLLAFGLGLGSAGCASLSQLNLIPVEQDPVLGAEAYPQLLENERLISSGPEYTTVVSMTDKLVAAANGLNPDIAGLFDWEVKLVDRPELVNAWCLPGGKMAVYTGIIPVARDATGDYETGLAVVMGHEIAHATLRHGTRAMTRQMGSSAIIALVGLAMGGDASQTAALTQAGAQLAANLGNLYYGRDAELEADRRGLIYMATAGYDPRAAVGFWERMRQAAGGNRPPQWLSTHPTNEKRIAQIQSLLPEVIPIYEQSRGTKSYKPR